MSEKIATNLIGNVAQITMGCEVNDQTRACYKDTPGGGITRYFGEKCVIVAVYKTEGTLMATVRITGFSDSTLNGGKLIECAVEHLRLQD